MYFKRLHRASNCTIQDGITLIESLIAITIISLLAVQSAPDFKNFLEKQEVIASTHQLTSALRLTRHAAVNYNFMATLCPWDKQSARCVRNWQRETMIFIDRNNDYKLDTSDQIVRQLPALPNGSQVQFRSFGNRPYLQMRPNGMTNYQNGHILYCPPSGNPKYAHQIIIGPTGRLRLARDSDGDGISEDSQGRPLACTTSAKTL